MNERIKQLAEQAKFTWVENDKDITGGVDLEKFAELIVKECAGIVENKIGVSRYIHEAELLRECSATIKEHFGVQE
jgi:hypothetical protein